jgi:hypothetical protein
MAETKLSPRAFRIKAATVALCGDRGQAQTATKIGISKQLLNFILAGDRAVTDDVDHKVATALLREAHRLRKTATKLDGIADTILHKLEK